jgi:YHS domain-containing protein
MHLGVGFLLMTAVAAPAGATGVVQQSPAPPTTAAAEVTQCVQAQMVVDQLLAAGMLRLDSARQSNAAVDLRAAVDSLQTTMRDARAQLAACATRPPAAPMDHSKMPTATAPAAKPPGAAPMDHSKMPMGASPAPKPATGGKPPAAAPMDHSKMPMGSGPAAKPAPAEAKAQAVDPVCGLKVDPASAPQAKHESHTYSFCSEQHRQLFQKNPAKYLPKGK